MLLLSKPLHEDNHPQVTSASSSNATTSSPLTPLTEVLSAWLLSTLFPKPQEAIQDNTDALALCKNHTWIREYDRLGLCGWLLEDKQRCVLWYFLFQKIKLEAEEVHHSVCVSDWVHIVSCPLLEYWKRLPRAAVMQGTSQTQQTHARHRWW